GVGVRGRRIEDDGGEVRLAGGDGALGSGETDDKGIVTITGLPDGPTRFVARHDDFAAARPMTLSLLANGTIEATLTLLTPGYADLSVRLSDGSPAPGSRYRVRARNGDDSATVNGKTDAEGKALVGPLAAGSYLAELVRETQPTRLGGASFVMSTDEGSAIGGSEQRFTITAGETTIVLVRKPVLTRVFGTVTGVDGPASGCNVQLSQDDPETPAVQGMGSGRTVTTAADGSFEIEDVEPGRYRISYGRIEHIVKAETTLTVPPDTPELRQDLVLRTGTIRVQAWSRSKGAPIADAEVEVVRPRRDGAGAGPTRVRMMMVSISTNDSDSGDSTMMTIGAQRAKTGPDGWAEVEGVPVGDYDVRITHKAHSPGEHKGVTVDEGKAVDIGRVEMSAAGTIRGKVVASDGGAVQMALVSHRPIDGEDGQPTPAMGGAFRIDALPTGRYVLHAREISLNGGGPAGSGPDVEVEVVAGETATVELRLPPR
ncbi:MAG: hypothetical protein KDC98_06625, partial [Planctomycetes bacterium]|nr:hypothetical protein [Planctomycetota bacterium]